jgi:hypothetical protein
VPEVIYTAGTHTFTRDAIGTRYVMMAVRTLVDPNSSTDTDAVHRLQDALTAEQGNIGTFEVPDWDPVSQKAVRDALLALASTLPGVSTWAVPRPAPSTASYRASADRRTARSRPLPSLDSPGCLRQAP